ncbi:MAG: HAD family hydrolase [Agathobacter sp.]
MLSKMQEVCEKFQYISFDIFDTLIKRLTPNPKGVFTLVQAKYLEKFGETNAIEEFAHVRMESERIARIKNKEEITLDDIYAEIAGMCDQSIAERYRAIEIETELKVCVPYNKIQILFDWCLSHKKTVYITSDMYLPKDVIERILEENGYRGYKRLFLSCESGNTKIAGTLYEELLREEHIQAGQLLHIGDNTKSDILSAVKKGIHTFQVKEDGNEITYRLDKTNNGYPLYNFIRYTNPYTEIFASVGYECFGPLLYGFMEWLKKEVVLHRHEKVFFFSRDGFIMQKVYETLKDDQSPQSYYLYVSRRALQVAAIHFNPQFDYVMSHMFIPRSVSVRWLLNRWGMDTQAYKEQVESIGFKLEEEFSGENIVQNEKVRKLYQSLYDEIISNSEKEYRAFEQYLDENGVEGNVAIVDIGWYGNMQNSLMTMLSHMNRQATVTGYYLGIVPDSEYQNQYDMQGYLFGKGKNEELYPKFKYISSLMELFFMAPHGSAKSYGFKDGNAIVELLPFEFENTYTFEKIKQLQECALEFVRKYKNRADIKELSEKEYLAPLLEQFICPTLETSKAFGDLQTWDDKWIVIAPKYPFYKWFLKPKAAIKNFINASWKMGYLKRNLCLPLRYDSIVYQLREIYKNNSSRGSQ